MTFPLTARPKDSLVYAWPVSKGAASFKAYCIQWAEENKSNDKNRNLKFCCCRCCCLVSV